MEWKFLVPGVIERAEFCGTANALDNNGKLDEVSQDPPPTLLARGLPLRSLSFRAFLQLSYLIKPGWKQPGLPTLNQSLRKEIALNKAIHKLSACLTQIQSR